MTDDTKDDGKNNIKELSFEKDKTKGDIEKFRREMENAVLITQEVAKFKFAQFKAFTDAGFSEQQAMELLKADMK